MTGRSKSPQFGDIRRVLVAARGAAAVRLAKSVHEAGLESVVLLADHDDVGGWSEAGDYVVNVPDGPSGWPDPEHVLAAGVDSGCDALLPGWDDQARSAEMAELCARYGLAWLGSPPELLAFAADRAKVREFADELGLSVVPGTGPLTDVNQAIGWAMGVGFPVALKPARGRVRPLIRADTLEELAVAAAGMLQDGPIMVERYVLGAREIEVPLVGDGDEAVVAIGTRDVTGRIGGIRRIWIGPAGGLGQELEEEMMVAALALASSVEWRGIAAAQFLVTDDGRPYLLDLRPGLQAADAVTERIYGVDLVDAALRVGMGQRLQWGADEVEADGVAIGVRLRVTDRAPASLVAGSPTLPADTWLVVAAGETLLAGDELGHLLVHSPSRQAGLVRAKVAADALDLNGIPCALPGLRRVLADRRLWECTMDREEIALVAGADPDV
ncbi:MAG: hypothetical protein GXP62_19145 [Oligoflexia bacterium]|nr:hypothetical protein [Oligoflexia bacterium]